MAIVATFTVSASSFTCQFTLILEIVQSELEEHRKQGRARTDGGQYWYDSAASFLVRMQPMDLYSDSPSTNEANRGSY